MNDWQSIEKKLLIDIIKMDEPRQQAFNALKGKVCNYITEINGDKGSENDTLNKIRDFTDDSYARSEALRKGNVSEDDRIIGSVFEASENGSETVCRELKRDYAKQITNLSMGDTFIDPSCVYTTLNASRPASRVEKRSAKLVQLIQNYNHRHDRLGRFARATGGGTAYDDYHEITISEHGKADRTIRISSKRSADIDEISRKAGTSDYARELEKVPDDVVKHIANENIPRITVAELNNVRRKRRAAYLEAGKTDEDFERSNQALLDTRGSGGEFYRKAEIEGADLGIEKKLSKELMGDDEILVFRQQDGKFQKTGHNETSRWSDIPYAGNGSGKDYYSAIVTKDNIVIHPLVLYSADKNSSVNIVAGREREYILENSKIDKIKKGIRLV